MTSFGSFASFLAGLGVFSVLGHMAFVTGQNVTDVVAKGLIFYVLKTNR